MRFPCVTVKTALYSYDMLIENSVLVAAASVAGVVGTLAASKRAREACFFMWWSTFRVSNLLALMTERSKLELLSAAGPLSGRVLEVGSGDGVRLPYLCGSRQPAVTEVVCVEPNALMHTQLRRSMDKVHAEALAAGIEDLRLTLFDGTLEDYARSTEGLSDEARRFDVVATLLVLCSVPEGPAEALATCARLLKPRGRLLYLEHVQGRTSTLRAVQRAIQPVYGLFGDGCDLCRDTGGAIDLVEGANAWTRRHHREGSLAGGLLPLVCGVCEAPPPGKNR